MATQTGSIDLAASNGVHLFAEAGFTNAEQTYATKSELSVTNDAVALRATKTEAAQMAQPNLAPLFSMDHSSVYDATDNPSGYWRTKLTGNGFTQLDDGWTHFEYDNTSGSSLLYKYIRPARVPSIVPGAPYTILVEIRNNAPTGTGTHDFYLQQIANNQFWGNVTGETIDADHVTTTTTVDLTSCGASFVRRSYRLADTAHLTDESGFLFTYAIRTAAGCTNSLDIRMSIYEGIYDGPYKPYSGNVLYATQSELKVTADGISSVVSTKVGNNEIISKINQSAESVQIQASKVEITGDAVFSAINNDTGTTKISGGKIDATSITIGGSGLATQADVDSIEVGGRNLVLGTSFDTPDAYTKTADGSHVVRRYELSEYASSAIRSGAKVTVTFEGKVSAGSRPMQVYIGYYNGTTATTIIDGGSPTPTFTTEWTKLSRTLDFDSDLAPTWIQVTATSSTGSSGTTYSIRGMKLEIGNKATDWTPAPEDTDASIATVQDNLNATRTWYATSSSAAGTVDKVATITPATTDFALAVGTVVAVKFDYANSVAAPTLNVNGTGAKDIKRYGTTAPSTSAASSWNAGSVVTLTYDGTNWQINNWLNNNDNYFDRENYKVPLAASAAISAGRVAVVGSDGKLKTLAASAFDYTKPILYVATAYTSANVTDVTTRTSNYTFWGTAFTLTNTHSVAGAAAGMAVYIVGTVSSTTFTPNSTVLTCTTPTSANGLVYLRLGIMTSATAAVLESQHPMYMFHDGSFQQCDPATVASAKTATNYISADSNGIKIANANPETATTYQHLTATSTEFVVEGDSMLELDGTNGARVGKEDGINTCVGSGGFYIRDSNDVRAGFEYEAASGSTPGNTTIESSDGLKLYGNVSSIDGTETGKTYVLLSGIRYNRDSEKASVAIVANSDPDNSSGDGNGSHIAAIHLDGGNTSGDSLSSGEPRVAIHVGKESFEIGKPTSLYSTGSVSVANQSWVSVANLTIPSTGTWMVVVTGDFASNATGRRVMACTRNAAPSSTPSFDSQNSLIMAPANGAPTKFNSSAIIDFDAGDVYYAGVWQNSGSALTTRIMIKAVRLI